MFFKKYNFNIIISIAILLILSIITLIGILPQLFNYGDVDNEITFIFKQVVGILVGVGALITLQYINLDKAYKYIKIAYWILFVMLLILALDPPIIGDIFVRKINGARGWFHVPYIGTIQPVEFMKITQIFFLGNISKNHFQSNENDWDLVKKYLVIGFLPCIMVFVQPDAGGAMLLGVPTLVMMMISLKNKKLFFKLIMAMIIGALIFSVFLIFPAGQEFLVKYTPIELYQLARINAWLYPFDYDRGYQLSQSLILIGSAGLFGNGYRYFGVSLPEPHTDVIFSEFVGMFGIIAGIVLIILYFNLLFSFLNTALKTKQLNYKIIVIGYSVLFLTQIAENIGMMLGVFPITGIVLPFFSYGMSAMITYLVIAGIIISIDREKNI